MIPPCSPAVASVRPGPVRRGGHASRRRPRQRWQTPRQFPSAPWSRPLLVAIVASLGRHDQPEAEGQHRCDAYRRPDAGEHADRRRSQLRRPSARRPCALIVVVQRRCHFDSEPATARRAGKVVAGGTDRCGCSVRPFTVVRRVGIRYGLGPIAGYRFGWTGRVGTHVGDVTNLAEGLGGASSRDAFQLRDASCLEWSTRRAAGAVGFRSPSRRGQHPPAPAHKPAASSRW